MSQPRTLKYTSLWVVGLAFLAFGGMATGCGGGGEEADIISRFFSASRMGDRTTAGNIAMVAFDPEVDGRVGSFDVISVEEEQRRPLRMRELAQQVTDARANQQSHGGEMKLYQDDNLDAIARVIEAERAGDSVARRDEEVQAAWTTWREESQANQGAVSDAERALLDESQIAEISVFDPSNPIDVSQYEGELLSKEITIEAAVTMGDSSTDRTMVIVLQKVELGSGEDMIDGRWIITSLN